MRVLHVAAMPFPSQQGTQALVHAFADATSQAGHDTHLLCYPHGAFSRATRYSLHRSTDIVRDRSLRSGPSARKALQDIQLARDLQRLHAALRPGQLIAHHVEAAWAAHLAGLSHVTFVAHTSLSSELGSYFHRAFEPLLSRLGRFVDRRATRPATRAFAISPSLCTLLARETARTFDLLTPPWSVHPEIDGKERDAARASLGLARDAEVVLYAGNLDAYQGLDGLCEGLELAVRQRSRLRWLIVTASDARAFLARLSPALRMQVQCVRLDADEVRRRAHAASDLALVPRKIPGGLPIKLLDALAHGVPVLTCERATAGYEFGEACTVLTNDDALAWAPALTRFFDLSHQHRKAFAQSAREVVRRQHHASRCVEQLLSPRS